MSDEIPIAPTNDSTTRNDGGDFVFSLASSSQGQQTTMPISTPQFMELCAGEIEREIEQYFADDNYFVEDDDISDFDEYVMDDSEPKTKPASKTAIEGLEKVKIDESLGEIGSCSVCLEEMSMGTEARRLPCSHIYHAACVIEWLKHSNMCPLCRHKMPVIDFDLNVNYLDSNLN